MEEALEVVAQEPRAPAQPQPQQEAETVCVAVNLRPLIDLELAEGCKPCLRITPGEPQVGHGQHLFTYDHVFGIGAEPPSTLYDRCVAPLVDGLFKGYNATVFAYGQTGSGKTYTMGSAFTPGGEARGVIPNVMMDIFSRIQAAPKDVEFTVRVGFVEIHKEEIHDLLCTRGPQPAVHIREVVGGGICLAGANEREVRSREEMVEVLEQGTLLRATASTGMNKQSSRSHAIFTITLEQRKMLSPATPDAFPALPPANGAGGEDDSAEDDEDDAGLTDDAYLCAKMHLVDLAGSERAKRTKAVGQRLQEGININKGLLALGNVINALSEGKQHIPYRDSKLTRMLQDSLGGNSRTVMIACVSPADVNLEESLNTLRYANRARCIRNKPVVNRDPVAAQIAHMRQQMAALRAENANLKHRLGLGDGAVDFGPGDEVLRAAVDDLEARNKALQADNKRLRVEVDSAQEDVREATEKMIVAQAQRDRLAQKLQQLDPAAAAEAQAAADAIAGSSGAGDGGGGGEGDVIHGHLQRIAELEREVKRLKQVSRLSGAIVLSSRRQSMAPGGSMPSSPFHFSPFREQEEQDELCELEFNDEEFAAQEQAHTMQVAQLNGELARLQREMEIKQAAMQSMSQHSALKLKYDERLKDLQAERDELQRERYDLLHKLESLQAASEEERLALKQQYESRIKQLDQKVKLVQVKERRAMEMERMKGKAEEACKKLEQDITSIKQQKVSLVRQMEKGVKEFGEFKKQRDRELLQLKKQGRLNAAQLQKLEALHSKQQAVLRRKTEEAEAARRRLKELEDRHKMLPPRPPTAAPAAATADRPFTAPPAAGTGAPAKPQMAGPGSGPASVGASGVERSVSSFSGGSNQEVVECQPNPLAPLLRDEKGRREWVEGELDAYCSSYELQKVVEGERAMRSEVQRQLREVEKQLAALKNPEWWPGQPLMSPSVANEKKLQQRKLQLHQQSELHSKQFEQAQAKLMEARQAEEAKGGGAADARRWNGVRTVVQARALLKTLFRSATQHKSQAYEAQAQATELAEEIELLRLKLDIAEQEKYEAQQRAAESQALLSSHMGTSKEDAPVAATPAKQSAAGTPMHAHAGDVAPDDGLRQAHEILVQLNEMATDENRQEEAAGCEEEAEGGEQEEEAEEYEEEEEEDEEDDDDDEEEEQSEDEERHALWDPSTATPLRGGAKARKQAGSGEGQGPRRRRRSSTTSSGSVLLPEEQPVLAHLNECLRKQGKEAVSKPTVALMKEVLKDKVIGGQRWRLGSKKREDLIRDYRIMLGLQPDVDSPAPSQQAQQRSTADGSTTTRSRVLEHTASSLARCAATLAPNSNGQQHLHGSSRAFGSPVQAPRSKSSTQQEHGEGSTPVGAEGLTPEGAAPGLTLRERQRSLSSSPSKAAAGSRGAATGIGAGSMNSRDLQLEELHRQLTALAGGAMSLGLNPNRSAERSPSPPARRHSRTASESGGGGGCSAVSPFRRSVSLSPWAAKGSSSPVRGGGGGGNGARPATSATSGAATSPLPGPRLWVDTSTRDEDFGAISPALVYRQRAEQCKQQAAQAMQKIDAELQSARHLSSGRTTPAAAEASSLQQQQAWGDRQAQAGEPQPLPLHSSNLHSRTTSMDVSAFATSSRGSSPEVVSGTGFCGPADKGPLPPDCVPPSPARQGTAGGLTSRSRPGTSSRTVPPSPCRKAPPAWKPL